jgi:hypothetical protein
MLVAGPALVGAVAAETCDDPLALSIQRTRASWSEQANASPADAARADSWIQVEMKLIDAACARGKDVEAAWRLEQVQRGIALLRRAAAVRRGGQAKLRFASSCSLSADLAAGRRTMNVEPTPSTLSAVTSP